LKLPKVTAVISRRDSQTITRDMGVKCLPQTWPGIYFLHSYPHGTNLLQRVLKWVMGIRNLHILSY